MRTNIAGGREAEAADETRTQVADDVAVQVGHDKDIKLGRVLHQLHARIVHDHLIVLDVWELLLHMSTKTISFTCSRSPSAPLDIIFRMKDFALNISEQPFLLSKGRFVV